MSDNPMSDNQATRGGFVERLKGKAKRAAGSVLGNEQLTREGELHEQKADAAQEAEVLDAEAAQQREEAQILTRDRELSVEEQELAAAAAAEAREVRLEQEQREATQRVDREYAAREASVERDEEAQRAAVAAEEARATQARAEEDREARRIADEAERARATADLLDHAANDDSE